MFSGHLYFQGTTKSSKPPRVAFDRGVRPSGIREQDAGEFFEKLFAAVDLPVAAYRGSALSRRVPACLRLLRAPDLEAAWRKLESNPKLLGPVLSAVLLGVTEFCRDRLVFQQLLAILSDASSDVGRPLRVWSAACSEGHELYSAAILLNESGRLDGAELLGTDCRADAISWARVGEFATGALEALEDGWRSRYFVPSGCGWRVVKKLKGRIRWKQADLLRGAERGPWDIVLWRNMAIYLAPSAAERVWMGIFDELAPGGCLVTGKADYPPRLRGLEKIGPCIYRKTKDRE